MSGEIEWHGNFYGISWAYEKDRLVVSTVFEDKKEAMEIAKEVKDWSDKFTRLTIIEKENGEYSICCYQDPQISKNGKSIGLSLTSAAYAICSSGDFSVIIGFTCSYPPLWRMPVRYNPIFFPFFEICGSW